MFAADTEARLKDFEKVYYEAGPFHHDIKGFSKWWTYDNYRILASWIGKDGMTLDLACGDGKLWSFLDTDRIVGLDHAPTGLAWARRFRCLPLVRADMTSLPFKSASFETAVCSLSFQYLPRPDLELCLSDLGRVLIKGGRLVLSYPNVRAGDPGDGSNVALPYGEFVASLEHAGFRTLAIKVITRRIPNRLFRWSTRPVFNVLSYLYYRCSKIRLSDPRRSYHYALSCRNGAPAVKEKNT